MPTYRNSLPDYYNHFFVAFLIEPYQPVLKGIVNPNKPTFSFQLSQSAWLVFLSFFLSMEQKWKCLTERRTPVVFTSCKKRLEMIFERCSGRQILVCSSHADFKYITLEIRTFIYLFVLLGAFGSPYGNIPLCIPQKKESHGSEQHEGE